MFGVDVSAEAVAAVRKMAGGLAPGLPAENFQVAGVEAMPFADEFADVVVCHSVLHFARDEAELEAMVRGLWRVLRPGGKLLFMEHVRAEAPGYWRMQRLADATIWPTCFGGCHAGRDPVTAIREAGFTVTSLTKYRLPDSRLPWPTAPHARGVAVRD